MALPRQAVADPVPEYAMKAAFLYNFALFTEWPEQINGSFNLCIFQPYSWEDIQESATFDAAVEAIKGRQVKDVRLNVLHVANAESARQCHVLYFSEVVDARARKVLDEIKDAQILTVTDTDNLMKSGAIIGMKLENRHLTFEINYTAAQHNHLMLSSKLLNLAHRVY